MWLSVSRKAEEFLDKNPFFRVFTQPGPEADLRHTIERTLNRTVGAPATTPCR